MGTASYRGGIPKAEALDIAMRYLAGAAPTATGMTFISPDGEMRVDDMKAVEALRLQVVRERVMAVPERRLRQAVIALLTDLAGREA